MENDRLKMLRERAEKVVNLIDRLNEVFPNYPRENAILAISACIQDAYGQAMKDSMMKNKK
jgi:hypothetical protein